MAVFDHSTCVSCLLSHAWKKEEISHVFTLKEGPDPYLSQLTFMQLFLVRLLQFVIAKSI